jgi:hypothetical protein
MDRISETDRTGGLGTAILARDVSTFPDQEETVPLPCQWPTMAIAGVAMRDLDAALAADPLFHRCPDGRHGRVDVRYWYLRPLEFSCRHCAEGGGVCVVDPATVTCRHRIARRTEHLLEG